MIKVFWFQYEKLDESRFSKIPKGVEIRIAQKSF